MTILSSNKTVWMFFNRRWKMTLLGFQFIIIITHDKLMIDWQFLRNFHDF